VAALSAADHLASLISAARSRNRARLRTAAIISLLLALLLWLTKWPSLRIALVVLLLGQLGVIVFLLARNRTLAHDLLELDRGSLGADPDWFETEARFLRAQAVFDTAARSIGFLLLGWGFWQATRNTAIALLLGVGYPLVAFFVDRRSYQRARRRLEIEKEALPRTKISSRL
jgi:hypothetical protein